MYNNLSVILNQMKKQTNNKEKETETEKVRFIMNTTPYNLRIDIERANRKSMYLYEKYNIPVPKFRILDKDENELVEQKPNKGILTIYGICILTFLAYSYFTKKNVVKII